jgi:hypothetical protein
MKTLKQEIDTWTRPTLDFIDGSGIIFYLKPQRAVKFIKIQLPRKFKEPKTLHDLISDFTV